MATNHAYNSKLHNASMKRAKRAAFLRSTGITWDEVGRVMRISRQRAQQLAAKVQ